MANSNKPLSLHMRVRAVREAGRVERVHTVPHHGGYNNAEHSFGVATLCFLLWPEEEHLVRFALFHDVPERWTGDMPGQFRAALPAPFMNTLDAVERRISKILLIPSEHDLDEVSRSKLRAADRLELYFWCLEEQRLGNKEVNGVIDKLKALFTRDPPPEPAWSLLLFTQKHGWPRHPEHLVTLTEDDGDGPGHGALEAPGGDSPGGC